ncbi:MAG: serine/threonine protein kinase [Nitrosopumilus sp. B06]|nr:MAG: serine/threonine protein kinase [Nitrosopumilus sp. D6]RNJ80060.1 MAG: serine/threonine protein kinase [Nitrosopumilus sp. B06]
MARSFISIKRLADEPYSHILGYPRASKRQIRSRMVELEKLGVSSISFSGPTVLDGVAVLGKGYVGVVVLAKRNGKMVALKIRRTDSQRDGMREEKIMLEAANSVHVGPKVLVAGRNFLVMEYVDGIRIGRWLDTLAGAGRAKKLKNVVRDVLDDCYRLDEAGLDHGELSNISKHVMVRGLRPVLIDFDSSSTKRRPSNVTSITQAMFIGSGIAKKIQKIYKNPPKSSIIVALRAYKQSGTRESFEGLLDVLRV